MDSIAVNRLLSANCCQVFFCKHCTKPRNYCSVFFSSSCLAPSLSIAAADRCVYIPADALTTQLSVLKARQTVHDADTASLNTAQSPATVVPQFRLEGVTSQVAERRQIAMVEMFRASCPPKCVLTDDGDCRMKCINADAYIYYSLSSTCVACRCTRLDLGHLDHFTECWSEWVTYLLINSLRCKPAARQLHKAGSSDVTSKAFNS
jgi:hypothetical protein